MSAALLSHEMIPVEFINWAEYSPEFRLEFGMRGLRGKTPPAPPLDQSQSHTKKSPASCYRELCFRPDSQWCGSGPVRCRWLPLQPQCYVLPDAFYWLRSCTAPKMKKEKRTELRTAVLDSSQAFSPTPPGPMPSPFLQGPGAHYLRAVSGCWQIPQLWVAVALCYLFQSSPFSLAVSDQCPSEPVITSLHAICWLKNATDECSQEAPANSSRTQMTIPLEPSA